MNNLITKKHRKIYSVKKSPSNNNNNNEKSTRDVRRNVDHYRLPVADIVDYNLDGY